MKLVRYGAKGKELPGIIDHDGKLRSLAGLVNEGSEQFLSETPAGAWETSVWLSCC